MIRDTTVRHALVFCRVYVGIGGFFVRHQGVRGKCQDFIKDEQCDQVGGKGDTDGASQGNQIINNYFGTIDGTKVFDLQYGIFVHASGQTIKDNLSHI